MYCCIIFLSNLCNIYLYTNTLDYQKLWVPQNTQAEVEQEQYLTYFPPTSRFENVIATSKNTDNSNILTKDHLLDVMNMHESIQFGVATYDNEEYTLTDLCTFSGGACVDPTNNDVCNCLVVSVLKMWNYNVTTLEDDTDVMSTLNNYGTREDLEGVLGAPVFDNNGQLVSAEAISISYFLKDRSTVENGNTVDPINEAWEENVFLKTVSGNFEKLYLAYLSSRSFSGKVVMICIDLLLGGITEFRFLILCFFCFTCVSSDEFGAEITGDLLYVQVSYIVALLFLGATLGNKICGRGSRWAMSMATLIM